MNANKKTKDEMKIIKNKIDNYLRKKDNTNLFIYFLLYGNKLNEEDREEVIQHYRTNITIAKSKL